MSILQELSPMLRGLYDIRKNSLTDMIEINSYPLDAKRVQHELIENFGIKYKLVDIKDVMFGISAENTYHPLKSDKKVVIIDDVLVWEKRLIEAGEDLKNTVIYHHGDNSRTEYAQKSNIADLLKNKSNVVGGDGYDPRLNLAYFLYLFKQICTVTNKAGVSAYRFKSKYNELGFYCSRSTIITGLLAEGYKIYSTDATLNYTFNLSCEPINHRNTKKKVQFWEKARGLMSLTNPNIKRGYLNCCVEDMCKIENNQIVTTEVNLKSVFDHIYR